MKKTNLVNVFQGNGEIDLPEPYGIVKNWVPIKALSGNTSPAATLPFGKYSVCAYTAGYSSGYGINKGNYDADVPKLYEKDMRVIGFSHFNNSGVGAITVYYNYAVVTPFYGNKCVNYGIEDELGKPGYYSVILKETGIKCELTVTEFAAYHRYTFNKDGGKISIDFLNNGLYNDPKFRGRVENFEITLINKNTLYAAIILEGVKLHFIAEFMGLGDFNEAYQYEMHSAGSVVVKLSVSAVSYDDALSENNKAVLTFDGAKKLADDKWNEALSAIDIESENITEQEIFYSDFYHTLVKPNDWSGGSFLWGNGPFVVDFSTMWDIYKTQLPLVYSLFGKTSENIIGTLYNIGNTLGKFPNAFMLSDNFNIESVQARLLIIYTFYDAFKRGVKADWAAIMQTINNCLNTEDFKLFENTSNGKRHTHTLDMAGACYAVREMALYFNDINLANRMEKLQCNWKNAFDLKTGMLKTDSEYYEGNYRNYSFRLVPYFKERVAICGSEEKYTELLDEFFGYNGVNFEGNFEGFNNETDMETPYAYHYVKRYDRLCDILDEADKLVFRTKKGGTGAGGIPGNNDSGAISSCYIWNCLGIFPVSGTDIMLLSRPKFEKATLKLSSGKKLTILKKGTGKYPVSATFNDNSVTDMKITTDEFMQGGILTFNY